MHTPQHDVNRRSARLLSTILAVVLGPWSAATAATMTWSNAAGGAFENPANWTGGVPGVPDTAQFSLNADYAVTFAGSVTNAAINAYAPGGTLTLDIGAGNRYRSTGALKIQNTSGGAAIRVVSGTLSMGNHVYIGDQTTYKPASLTVTGPATALEITANDMNAGINGDGNSLTIANGAWLSGYRHVKAGAGANGGTNTITVSGSGSRVTTQVGGFYVGDAGSDNRGVFENGATAYVTGSSSGSGGIRVGSAAGSDRNLLTIRSGASVTNGSSTAYAGCDGNDNTLLVDDARFVSDAVLVVGYNGHRNTLCVQNGAQLFPRTHLSIGTEGAARSNAVVVTGTGSLLSTAAFDINVGVRGNYGALIVTNGATVRSYRDVHAGYYTGIDGTGSWNRIVVTGPGSRLVSDGNAGSRALLLGWSGSHNEATFEDQGVFLGTNSSTTIFLGYNAPSSSNRLFVLSGAAVTNKGNVVVGEYGSGNSLVVSNATLATDAYTYIGNKGGSDNSVLVQDGGIYVNKGHLYLGYNAASSNNSMTVSGEGSAYVSQMYDLDVGNSGPGNRLSLEDGGSATVVRNLYVGRNSSSSNNVLRVAGGNLQCNTPNTSEVQVKYGGAFAVVGSGGSIALRQLHVTQGAGLDLTLDAAGVTPIACSSTVTYDATTTLNVHADEYQKAGGGTLTVMTFANSASRIPDGNITVSPPGTVVTQTNTSLELRVPGPGGTIILVR